MGHSILVIAYHLLRNPDNIYQDLGVQYFDQQDRAAIERNLVKRLEHLGYQVILQPIAAVNTAVAPAA